MSTRTWNALIHQPAKLIPALKWLKVTDEPFNLWEFAIRRAQWALAGPGVGIILSGVGQNGLEIIKDVRGGVWGALECDNEAAALKMAALHQALKDLRGPQYAIAPPLVYYGNHEGHVHIPQHLAIGYAPQ